MTAFLLPFCPLDLENRMTVCMGYPAMTLRRRAGKRRRKGVGKIMRKSTLRTSLDDSNFDLILF